MHYSLLFLFSGTRSLIAQAALLALSVAEDDLELLILVSVSMVLGPGLLYPTHQMH